MNTRTDRFNYEAAENFLDAFALGGRHPGFLRAYRKLKYMITAYASLDYMGEGVNNRSLALSYAWEDVQMAFSGHGDHVFTGVVCELWSYSWGEQKRMLRDAITTAFNKAEEGTHGSVERRYLPRWRMLSPQDPDEGFHNSPILPTWGPTLREWAEAEGEPIGKIEDQCRWLSLSDQFVPKAKKTPAVQHLTLLQPLVPVPLNEEWEDDDDDDEDEDEDFFF